MSRLNGMAHAEQITREAAQAINIDLTLARWSNEVGGLILRGSAEGMRDARKTFAPLVNPADAYELESRLMLNATYHRNGTGWLLQMTAQGGLGAMFEAMKDGEDKMMVRMQLATVMAALHLMTNGAPDRRASDHGE